MTCVNMNGDTTPCAICAPMYLVQLEGHILPGREVSYPSDCQAFKPHPDSSEMQPHEEKPERKGQGLEEVIRITKHVNAYYRRQYRVEGSG